MKIVFVENYRQFLVGDEIDPGCGVAAEYIAAGVARAVKPGKRRREAVNPDSVGREERSAP